MQNKEQKAVYEWAGNITNPELYKEEIKDSELESRVERLNEAIEEMNEAIADVCEITID